MRDVVAGRNCNLREIATHSTVAYIVIRSQALYSKKVCRSYKINMSQIPSPPYSIHPSVSDLLNEEYTEFFNKNLTNAKQFLYTDLIPVKTLREGGNIMPGQPPLVPMKKTYDTSVKSTVTDGVNIPIRVFVPQCEAPENGYPCIIWFHGGGWVLGNISSENSFCTQLASLCKCVVITVDYRMAPEDPFPAAVDDALDVVEYAMKHPEEFNINCNKIGVAGSSAGGNLSAIVSHCLLTEKKYAELPKLVFQVLVVPVCDNTADKTTHLSWKEMEFVPQLSANKMMWYRNLYLPDPKDWTNPLASPQFFPAQSFKQNPPCFIAAAQCDVLRTEAEIYAKTLKDNGVECKLEIYPGVPHPVMAMGQVLTEARNLLDHVTKWINQKFIAE